MDTKLWMVSKIFWEIVSPERLFLLILLGGVALLWTKKNATGRWLITLLSGVFLFISVFPVANYLLLPLENRFPIPKLLSGDVAGIIVLGGSENTRITVARGQPALRNSAERLTMFVTLAQSFPEAKLLFTGGSDQIRWPEYKETQTARMLFGQLGLDVSRVSFESEARHTGESSVLSYNLIKPKPKEKWVLIGSAYRMPRAFGAFKKAGWNIIPYPVDFRTTGQLEFDSDFISFSEIDRVSMVVREWLGLVAYRLTGHTETLFPGAVGGD